MKRVTLFTDGACSGNPGIGGWGAVLMYNGFEKRISGAEPETTNNRGNRRVEVPQPAVRGRRLQRFGIHGERLCFGLGIRLEEVGLEKGRRQTRAEFRPVAGTARSHPGAYRAF